MATQGEKPGQPGALTKTAPRDAGAAGREPPPDANFIVTKEYRRFTEFADAVRRECYIGLCYGQPGVGKTLSVRRYSAQDSYSYGQGQSSFSS
jgi:Cdc6-like AAA superfamily ATPase